MGRCAIGYEEYNAARQTSSNTAELFDKLLGRQLSHPPTHLSRVLFVPRHVDGVAHIPLYNFSEPYRQAVDDTPLASTLYMIKLMGLAKPHGDGTDGDVEYLIDFEGSAIGGGTAKIQKRSMSSGPRTVEIHIPTSLDDDYALVLHRQNTSKQTVLISVSYPIPPSSMAKGVIPHPYFTFCIKEPSGIVTYQWQIHPITGGPINYELVRLPENNPPGAAGSEIVAVYSHIGFAFYQGYTEGVLMLPTLGDEEQLEREGMIVGSLIAVLRCVRNIKIQRAKKSGKRTPSGDMASDVSEKHGKKKLGVLGKAFGMR